MSYLLWQDPLNYAGECGVDEFLVTMTPLRLRPDKRYPTVKEGCHFAYFPFPFWWYPTRATTIQYLSIRDYAGGVPAELVLTRAPMGSPAERAPLGVGKFYPSPLLTHEPATVARLARRQSKALNEYFFSRF